MRMFNTAPRRSAPGLPRKRNCGRCRQASRRDACRAITVLNGHAGISAEMALRLSEALGTTSELWTGMQAQYELWQVAQRPRRKLPRLKAA